MPIDGIFPVYSGEATGTGSGPWFNWRGKRAECDTIAWDAPDGQRLIMALVIPCPSCEKPFIFPGIRPDMWREDDEGQLSFAVLLQCNGAWVRRDPESGQVFVSSDGKPLLERCQWVGVIRGGVSHHPQCQAVHLPHCRHPSGQPCVCRMARFDGHDDCHCGAVTK